MHPKNRKIEKAKDFKKSMFELIKYCKNYYLLFFVAVISAIVSSILTIIGPDKVKTITNLITEGIFTGINIEKIKSVATFLIIIYVISAILSYLQHYTIVILTNKFSKRIRKDISLKINRMPLKYFDQNSYGDVLSRITNDVDTLSQSMHQSLGSLVSSTILLFGSVIMMFITNGLMAMTAIVSSILGFVFMFLVISKSQKYFEALQYEVGNLNGHIEEIYSGHNIVKAYNAEDEAIDKFNSINEELARNFQKGQFLSGLMHPFMGFIGNFGYVCVCVVGAMLTMNNTIDFGVIVAFMLYIRFFTQPLSQIAQSASALQSCAAASERVFEFLSEEELNKEKANLKKLDKNSIKGEIVFEHVKFGYNEGKEIIKDFNIAVKPGQKVAIVGHTGAGKTTIVNLLLRFYEINSGNIIIDGVNIQDLSREDIRDLFIMVLQDTWVFEGSIKENICYNTKNVKDKDVEKICQVVGLNHFIKTLPQGYNTILSDNDDLSIGQRQLLTIARGMIKNAPFLILDEATSNVDTRTEILVQKAMDKLTEGRTSFIIAHRLSTIKNADIILMLENGNIVEQGNHEELLKLNGKYAELYNSQFDKI